MDFLDPKKLRAHHIRLMIGYGLLTIAVALAAIVLLYQAHGFGVKQGKVIQNGLVFVQATPGPATVEVNGRNMGTTDARLVLEAGTYTMKLSRAGYHDWQRALTVEGGGLEHFTYPFLIPQSLAPAKLGSYQTAPGLTAQSPDRRWMLVQQAGQMSNFDVYDLKDPKKVSLPQSKQTVAIPVGLLALSAAKTAQPEAVTVVEWSNDNEHVLLQHTVGTQFEYILFSRKNPAESVNLTKSLQLTPNLVLTLQDKKYDHYFIHDMTTKTLSTVSLAEPQSLPLLTNVLAFKSYGADTVLYTSPIVGQDDKVQLKMYLDRKQYTIRTLPASQTYLLALSRYDNAWMVVAGVPADNRVYVYRDPVAALQSEPLRAPALATVLKVAEANNVVFSANSQLILAENGNNFAVYDAEYDRSHVYHLDQPLDAPQTKAVWLDGYHLEYVSGGKTIIFDYDGTNLQTLSSQLPQLPALFDTGYTTLYTLAKPTTPDLAKPEAYILSATPLRTIADQ